MTNLLKWILFPGALHAPQQSGGGGDGGARERKEEEARKAQLRARVDRMYGIGKREVVTSPEKKVGPFATVVPAQTSVVDDPNDPEAAAARAAMEAEKTKLAQATRGYYTDDLGRTYEGVERKNRFALARRGLMGGSVDIDKGVELETDRNLGATRLDEAVRRALSDLETSREQERLNAVSLINSGAGDSAVSAAQRGLQNSFDRVSSAQKTDIFTDLFQNTADATTGSNIAAQQAALAARYRDRLGAFFPTSRTSSGRVTSTG